MHVQLGEPDEHARAGELLLVLLVVSDHVAHVLAQEALDALAELLAALHIDLLHAVFAGLQIGGRREGRNRQQLLVVERDIGDEVLDHRERAHRCDRHGLVLPIGAHPRHTHQPRVAVDLGGARPALAGLAVPPHGEVARLFGLDAVNDVEHHLAGVHLDVVIDQATARRIPAPHLEVRRVCHVLFSFERCRTDAGGLRLVDLFVGEVLLQLVPVEQRHQRRSHLRARNPRHGHIPADELALE